MPTILLVRHGQAAAGFGSHRDPGLDDVGRAQAEAVAEEVAARFEAPVPIYSSPLKRAQETAAPLARKWGSEVILEPRVAEIPSPTEDLRERARWLRGVMAGKWTELQKELLRWRQEMIDCVLGFETDTVVVCHFIAINVVVGAATGAEELIVFRPDNASVADIGTDSGTLELIALGDESDTRVT
ncbi:MAG: phosphoglycerate mutase family protein [Gammaproteobacteria bacterium]|nr:phosphoglycerate mutase family protein [Gammaproteobacteria bacterium]